MENPQINLGDKVAVTFASDSPPIFGKLTHIPSAPHGPWTVTDASGRPTLIMCFETMTRMD